MTAVALSAGTPEFLGPVVVFLFAAALIGYVFVRARVVPIVGFLLAGVVIGPNQLGLVANAEVVQAAAEVGVLLLLFTIGMEFSLERLLAIRRYVLVGGGLQVLLSVAVTAGLVMGFGTGWQDALFTGFLVSLSSTAIVMKVLAGAGRTRDTTGQAALAVLIFQDLIVVLMVLLVPLLAASAAPGSSAGSAAGPWELARVLGTAVAVLALVLVVARKVMPPLLEKVARTCSPELFLLTVVAIGLGTAYLTSLAGVSLSLGAFLAGLVVSESPHSSHALSEVLPLQIVFSAVFFVSIGMLLDVRFVLDHWLLILGLAVGTVLIKTLTGAVAVAALRIAVPTALGTGLLLAQIGEFSFVLQQSAPGLSPAGLGANGAQALIAVTVLLMALTPVLSWLGERLGRRARPVRRRTPEAPAPQTPGGVLVIGWGPVASEVAALSRDRGCQVTVTTLSPDLAAQAAADGHRVVRGDALRQHVLEEAGLHDAGVILIAEDEAEHTIRLLNVIRRYAPDAAVIVRPTDEVDPAALVGAGASRVVDGTRSVGRTVKDAMVRALGREPDTAPYPDTSLPVAYEPDPDTACPHTQSIQVVLPSTPGCAECLREGRTDWVHLRTCLTCGHVGCCDSSPRRHATRHWKDTGHPIIASAEPDEDWAYCYADDTTLDPIR
ncbi:cation:proton antiporter [Bailinhaonella thermotolerans]|uniref:cation:proton antiporter n=1 Tax=Bailinhaonella thermotolerans TaxID=1070861 RepID=UPI001F5B8743|nr:cation:proton antiporter [Bailinhaonella thermotolerans]